MAVSGSDGLSEGKAFRPMNCDTKQLALRTEPQGTTTVACVSFFRILDRKVRDRPRQKDGRANENHRPKASAARAKWIFGHLGRDFVALD
jgi:hypothetical protein